jgi:hypothetical protein
MAVVHYPDPAHVALVNQMTHPLDQIFSLNFERLDVRTLGHDRFSFAAYKPGGSIGQRTA